MDFRLARHSRSEIFPIDTRNSGFLIPENHQEPVFVQLNGLHTFSSFDLCHRSLFWGTDMSSALVPPFAAQPLFQALRTDLRIRSAKTGDVCLISGFVEPAEH